MPILPQSALFVILNSWSLVLRLVSAVWYERQRSRYQKHWLWQLEQVADLTPLEQGCAGFHASSGRGAPVIHTIARLVRALLVRHLQALSFRQSEELIDNHLLYKQFVGYEVFEPPPDHTTLCRFELWVLEHQPDLFLDEVLKQVYRLYPEERERLALTDTFGMFVRGARKYLIDLLRDLGQGLLTELAELDPVRHQQVLAQLNEAALFGQKGDKITPALKPDERAERLQQVVNAALDLQAHLLSLLNEAPSLSPDAEAKLRLWLAAIAKVIADETTVTPDPEQPNRRRVVERPHGKKGSYRIACANDLDATYRDHGKGQAELQHNAALLTSDRFVHATEVVTGSAPDPTTLAPLLEKLHEHHDFFPPKVAADQIYGNGKTRAEVAEVSQGQTQLIALVPDYEKRTDRFVPSDFILSEDGFSLTCPNQVTSTKIYFLPDKDGYEFRFTHKMCRGCPFWLSAEQLAAKPDQDYCRTPDCKPKSHRQVFISFYRDETLAAIEYNKTDQFKQEMKQRPLIERIIFNLTHFFGARHARSTGLPKANFQLSMAAAAFNLRQLIRLPRRPKPAAA
ncbi:MAG: transposase [Anaerolineales bacterium]|nr:transposase [Anaerolineales bacterium]